MLVHVSQSDLSRVCYSSLKLPCFYIAVVGSLKKNKDFQSFTHNDTGAGSNITCVFLWANGVSINTSVEEVTYENVYFCNYHFRNVRIVIRKSINMKWICSCRRLCLW